MVAHGSLQVCPPRADAKRPLPACPSQNFETPPKRRRSLKGADTEAPNALKAACEALRKEFAEDYFLAPAKTRLPPDEIVPRLMKLGGQAEACQEALAQAKQKKSANALVTENKEEWNKRLEKGFSLLFEGVGSKYRLLENFAQVLSKSGIPIAIFHAFDKGSSLAAFLRELLEQHGWKGAGSLPRLCSSLLTARRSAAEKHPLVLVIHNLEVLPAPHLSALASLVATKEIWLVASVDNIFADAAFNMDPYAAMDFSFSYEEVHTRDSYYTVELKGRYPDGLPSCTHPLATKKQTKASLGLVLRCLTQNQKELVQEIAKEQLSRGQQGVPWDELVVLASDLMIANNHTKLRRLLSELTDHQILIERNGRFELAVKEAVLRKLAEGESVEDVDVEGEGDAADDVEHEEEEFSEASEDDDDE